MSQKDRSRHRNTEDRSEGEGKEQMHTQLRSAGTKTVRNPPIVHRIPARCGCPEKKSGGLQWSRRFMLIYRLV